MRYKGVQHTNWFASLSASPLPAAKVVKTADLFIIFGVFAGGWRKKADVNIFSKYVLG